MSKLLLLEPDKIMAENISAFFERNGHSVHWQVEPQAAIINADVETFDLIILDLLLAGRSGVEFIYEFRSYPDWQNIPIVVYSSLPEREVSFAEAGFKQTNIIGYYNKSTTSVTKLVGEVNNILSAVQ